MLATYMGRMRNNNLEIRIAGPSCRPQLAFWKEKTIGIIFNWKPIRELSQVKTEHVCCNMIFKRAFLAKGNTLRLRCFQPKNNENFTGQIRQLYAYVAAESTLYD